MPPKRSPRRRAFTLGDALKAEREALAEEAALDEQLSETLARVRSLSNALKTRSHEWAGRARARTAEAALHSWQEEVEPEPEPEPEPERSVVLIEPEPEPEPAYPPPATPGAGAPDWALNGERLSRHGLHHERMHATISTLEKEAVWENQRRAMWANSPFSAAALLPGERAEWSDDDGNPVERARLPQGWRWAVRAAGDADDDGWQYARHFRQATWSAQAGATNWVRRRRWAPAAETAAASAPSLPLATPAPTSTYRCVVEVRHLPLFLLHNFCVTR